jgi:hypothetical protein
MKECNGCMVRKNLKDFSKDKCSPDGIDYKCKECRKIYRELNKLNFKNYTRVYRENNKEKIKNYYLLNKSHIVSQSNKRSKERRIVDIIYKFKCNVRSLVSKSFKRACNGKFNKSQRTQEILGCSLEEFIKHLESLFTEGMTLENHGEWEIDHKIPLASAKTEEEIIKLNHYTNFQPLWKDDNRRKGDNY